MMSRLAGDLQLCTWSAHEISSRNRVRQHISLLGTVPCTHHSFTFNEMKKYQRYTYITRVALSSLRAT